MSISINKLTGLNYGVLISWCDKLMQEMDALVNENVIDIEANKDVEISQIKNAKKLFPILVEYRPNSTISDLVELYDIMIKSMTFRKSQFEHLKEIAQTIINQANLISMLNINQQLTNTAKALKKLEIETNDQLPGDIADSVMAGEIDDKVIDKVVKSLVGKSESTIKSAVKKDSRLYQLIDIVQKQLDSVTEKEKKLLSIQ